MASEFKTIQVQFPRVIIVTKKWHMRLFCSFRRFSCPNDGLLALSFSDEVWQWILTANTMLQQRLQLVLRVDLCGVAVVFE